MYSSTDIAKILVKDFDRSLKLFENINNDLEVSRPLTEDQKADFENTVKKCISMFVYEPKDQSSKYITIYCRFDKKGEVLRNKCRVDGTPYFGEKYKKTCLKRFSNVSPQFQVINSLILKELDNIRLSFDNPKMKTLLNTKTTKCLIKHLPISKNPYFLVAGLGSPTFRNINIKKFQMCFTFNLENEKVIYRITEKMFLDYNDPKNANSVEAAKFVELLKWVGDKEASSATYITNLVLPESITLSGEGFANTPLAKAYEKFFIKQDTNDEKNGIDNAFLKEELEQYEHTKEHDTGFSLAIAQLCKPSVVSCNIKYNVKSVVVFKNPTASNDFFSIQGYEEDEDDLVEDVPSESVEEIYQDFLEKNFASTLKMVKETKKSVEMKTLENLPTPPRIVVNEALLKQVHDEELDEKSDIDSDEDEDEDEEK